MQVPPVQMVPVEQVLPHSPQLKLSLLVYTHAPPGHMICPNAQADSQRSSTHTSPLGHGPWFGQLVVHRPSLHTFPPEQTVRQSPQ